MSHPDVCPQGERLQPGPEPEVAAGSSVTDILSRGRSCCGRLPPRGGAPGRWASGRCLQHHLGPRGQKAEGSLDRARG